MNTPAISSDTSDNTCSSILSTMKHDSDDAETAEVKRATSSPAPLVLDLDLAELCGLEADTYAVNFDLFTNLTKSKRTVAQYSRDDIQVGMMLGSGAFCKVHSAHVIDDTSVEYAIKMLDSNQRTLPIAAIDLVIEAKFLSCLDHANIIQLFGVTKGPLTEAFAKPDCFFLLLERMQETLEDKIKEWGDDVRNRGVPSLQQRLLTVAFGVCDGMSYIHSHKIVFRDLKPSNLGFCPDGTIKILDFGLAREIVDPHVKLTRETGSKPYMAPEVLLGENYGLPADVFSFALILWELCSLRLLQPTESANIRDVPPALHNLIERCSSRDPMKRPQFKAIHQSLSSSINRLGDESSNLQCSCGLIEALLNLD